MPIESERGCGYRQVGGLYLVSDPFLLASCDRLPLKIEPCPCCGETIRFSRGIQKIFPLEIWGTHEVCSCNMLACPICFPYLPNEKEISYYLMWVGKDYTVESFIKECKTMGASKRIAYLPKDFQMGRSWVFLAKQNLVDEDVGYHPKKKKKADAVFFAFKPIRAEYLIAEDDADEDTLADLRERGITPVVVPMDQSEHFKRKGTIKFTKRQRIQPLEDFM